MIPFSGSHCINSVCYFSFSLSQSDHHIKSLPLHYYTYYRKNVLKQKLLVFTQIFFPDQTLVRSSSSLLLPDQNPVRIKMPSSGPEDPSVQYSRFTGFVYVFNLIVGTGALTLPAAFHDAGWVVIPLRPKG